MTYQERKRIDDLLATERDIARLSGELEALLPPATWAKVAAKAADIVEPWKRLDYLLKARNRVAAYVGVVAGEAGRIVKTGEGLADIYGQDGEVYTNTPTNWQVMAHIAQANGWTMNEAGDVLTAPASGPNSSLPGATQEDSTISEPSRQVIFLVEADRYDLPTEAGNLDAVLIPAQAVRIYDGHKAITPDDNVEVIPWRQATAGWADILDWIEDTGRTLRPWRTIANWPRPGVHAHLLTA